MTDVRLAALAAMLARQNPVSSTRVAALMIQQLQRLQKIIPADVRAAAISVDILGNLPIRDLHTAGVTVMVLREMPTPVADNGVAFQWHTPDQASPGGWKIDEARTSALHTYTAVHGRGGPVGKADPSQATVTLALERADAPDLGDRFRIAVAGDLLEDAGTPADRIRWTGEVTDVVVDPTTGLVNVTGVGRLARHGRRIVDGTKWAVERDGARVRRILNAVRADVGNIDAGEQRLLAPTAAAPAINLLDLVVESTGGLLVEQRDGRLDWQDREHRRAVKATVTLDSSELVRDFTWTKRVGDLANVADVEWGEDGTPVRVEDATSVLARDPYPVTVSTALVDEADAYSLGNTIVGRRANPTWRPTPLVVDLLRSVIDPAKRAALLALQPGDRIHVTGLPAGGGAPESDLFVEGVEEAASRKEGQQVATWRLAITASDPRLSGVAIRWRDIPPDIKWTDIDPTISWLDIAGLEDATELKG